MLIESLSMRLQSVPLARRPHNPHRHNEVDARLFSTEGLSDAILEPLNIKWGLARSLETAH